MQLSFSTPVDVLLKIKEKLNTLVQQETNDFKSASCSISNFADLETMNVNFSFTHRYNYQVLFMFIS